MIANYQCIQGVDAVTQENVTKLSIGGTVRVTTMAVLLAIPALGWGEPAGLSSRGEVVAQGDSASGTNTSSAAIPAGQTDAVNNEISSHIAHGLAGGMGMSSPGLCSIRRCMTERSASPGTRALR